MNTAAPNGTCLSDTDVNRVLGYINPLVLDHRIVGAPWSGTTDLSNVGASSNGLGSGFLALAFRSPAHDQEKILKTLRDEHHVEIALREKRLRASPHFYNTEAQIDRLIELLPGH